jgi:hypothetical protein
VVPQRAPNPDVKVPSAGRTYLGRSASALALAIASALACTIWLVEAIFWASTGAVEILATVRTSGAAADELPPMPPPSWAEAFLLSARGAMSSDGEPLAAWSVWPAVAAANAPIATAATTTRPRSADDGGFMRC